MLAYPANWSNLLNWSNTSGISAPGTKELGLIRSPGFVIGQGVNPINIAINPNNGGLNGVPSMLYQVVMAPDDPKFMAVTCDGTNYGWDRTNAGANLGLAGSIGFGSGPKRIFVSSDGGNTWDMAYDGTTPAGWTNQMLQLGPMEFIRNIDISIDYGGKRDIGFVTGNGAGGGRWFVRASSGFNNWIDQTNNLVNPQTIPMPAGLTTGGAPAAVTFDFYALKFSPTYNGDSSVALVGATPADGTYFNIAQRDLSQNVTIGWAFATSINVRNATLVASDSPHIADLNNVCLQLPSDFSGQSSSLRRVYISLDAFMAGSTAHTVPIGAAKNVQDGIYRIDDTTVYVLMDNSANPAKSIYTIAYFGTYASGKLLAGERMGFPCTATVPTWFTDSPTTCPIPCWYPALKATTGAAGNGSLCAVGNKPAWAQPWWAGTPTAPWAWSPPAHWPHF